MTQPATITPVAATGEVTQVVEHFFGRDAGKIVSTLTRIFGVQQLDRAANVVHETLVRALQT
jgi:hypothetical protein